MHFASELRSPTLTAFSGHNMVVRAFVGQGGVPEAPGSRAVLAKRPFRRFADFDAANFKLRKDRDYSIVRPKDLTCILQIKGPWRTECLYRR